MNQKQLEALLEVLGRLVEDIDYHVQRKRLKAIRAAFSEPPKAEEPVPCVDVDVPARANGKINLLCTADAREWAKEFMRIFGDRKHDIDESLMLTWFANALVAGGDCEAGRQRWKNTRAPDQLLARMAEALRWHMTNPGCECGDDIPFVTTGECTCGFSKKFREMNDALKEYDARKEATPCPK